jgi:hypothetical protein
MLGVDTEVTVAAGVALPELTAFAVDAAGGSPALADREAGTVPDGETTMVSFAGDAGAEAGWPLRPLAAFRPVRLAAGGGGGGSEGLTAISVPCRGSGFADVSAVVTVADVVDVVDVVDRAAAGAAAGIAAGAEDGFGAAAGAAGAGVGASLTEGELSVAAEPGLAKDTTSDCAVRSMCGTVPRRRSKTTRATGCGIGLNWATRTRCTTPRSTATVERELRFWTPERSITKRAGSLKAKVW